MVGGGKVALAALVVGSGTWMACGAVGSDGVSLRPLKEGDVSHTNLMVTADGGQGLTCPNGTACFDVSSEKNITHIFVQVGFDSCAPADYQITVDGELITKLQTQGGPCNEHGQMGEDFIPRDVWFPLPRNQKTAHVCVSVGGAVPGLVRVGAKSAEECRDAVETAQCSNCEQPCPPDDDPPAISIQ